ncbi:MAG: hypothetical protein JWO46_3129, partial [Nocardioidaceae bacterium]|nr:hypothetical protein [Nocardioidaceae bacterium]
MDPRRLDDAWDFADPAGSEVRLRALMCAATGADRQLVATQVARSLGLQERYDEALDLLDVLPEDACREVRVRVLLERGRVQRSRGEPDATLFDQAVALAAGRGLEALHVDALHMAALVEPDVARRIQVTEAALAVASVATDQRARDWDASL